MTITGALVSYFIVIALVAELLLIVRKINDYRYSTLSILAASIFWPFFVVFTAVILLLRAIVDIFEEI